MPNRPFLSCAIAPETPAAENYRFTRRLTYWTFRSRADSAPACKAGRGDCRGDYSVLQAITGKILLD